MSGDELERRVVRHYESLGRASLDRRPQVDPDPAPSFAPRTSARRLALALATVLACVASAPILDRSSRWFPSTPPSVGFADALREAAMNHASGLEPEVRATDATALAAALDRLPFELAWPERLANKRIAGARYCSIDGRLAAHVRIRGASTGDDYSLFVTTATPNDWPATVERHRIDGIPVESWRENGMRYLLAGGDG